MDRLRIQQNFSLGNESHCLVCANSNVVKQSEDGIEETSRCKTEESQVNSNNQRENL